MFPSKNDCFINKERFVLLNLHNCDIIKFQTYGVNYQLDEKVNRKLYFYQNLSLEGRNKVVLQWYKSISTLKLEPEKYVSFQHYGKFIDNFPD
jgi:hypothetical protein